MPEVLVEHQLLAVADREPGRLLAAVLEREQPERRDRRGVGRLAARQRPPRTRRTSVSPPSRGRGRARAPRRGGGRASGTSSASATRPPRSSAAPVAPAPASSMTSRSPPTDADRLDRQAVLAGQQRRAPRRARGRQVTTSRDGLSPNRSTAGESATREPDARAEAAPHRALGEGDGEPAAGDVLGGGDEAARDRLADERLERPPRGRGRAPAGRPRRRTGQRGVGGAGQARASPRRRAGSRRRRLTKAGPTSVAMSSSRPTTPISGVGAIAPGRRLVVERDVAAGHRAGRAPGTRRRGRGRPRSAARTPRAGSGRRS